MIHVERLTKKFGNKTAVNDISFKVKPGEVVGLLGPNGAGKTTTLRILSGYLQPGRGQVTIGGNDTFSDALALRRIIGYLPENVPLYPEMRVIEYLRYRAQLKGLPAWGRGRRINEVCELCGITDVRRRIIGQLSRGYRQRVGLADALVHRPKLLILDEPTVGLDPNQIREVRKLITSLAGEHTILLSTHILPEAETVCERVMIMNEGGISASGTPDELRHMFKTAEHLVVELRGVAEPIAAALAALPNVVEITVTQLGAWVRCELSCTAGSELRPDISKLAAARQWSLRELRHVHSTLEDVFVGLTKKEKEAKS